MRFTALILAGSAIVHAIPQKGGRPHDEDPPPPPHLPEVAPPAPVTPGHTTPQDEDPYLPAPEENPCFSEGPSCDEIADVADEVLSDLLDLTQLISSPTSSSSSLTPLPFPTTTAVPTLIPVFDVAQSASIDPSLLGVLNSAELQMYASDPLCFFANLERKYLSAATASPSPSNTAGPASTTAPASTPASPTVSTDVIDLGFLTQTAVYTVIGSSDAADAQTYLFETFFPYWINTIYAPVSREATATSAATASLVTSTTTCAGLDGAPGFTTPYLARAGVGSTKATVGSSSTPTSTSTMRGGAVPTAEGRGMGLAGMVGAVGVVVFGAM